MRIKLERKDKNMTQFSRTEMLLGRSALKKLQNSKVAILGLGGVGSYVAEILARMGIGTLILIDNDIVETTNINRQIIALHSTIGQAKVTAAKSRVLDINPTAKVTTHKIFYSKDSDQSILKGCDYVVDATDTISSKLSLVEECERQNIPVISCMSTGNKLSPNLFEVEDIFKTSVCPVCKVMRHELKKRNITSLKVVYSKEVPLKPQNDIASEAKKMIGSVSFVPAAAGLILASEVVKDIISK